MQRSHNLTKSLSGSPQFTIISLLFAAFLFKHRKHPIPAAPLPCPHPCPIGLEHSSLQSYPILSNSSPFVLFPETPTFFPPLSLSILSFSKHISFFYNDNIHIFTHLQQYLPLCAPNLFLNYPTKYHSSSFTHTHTHTHTHYMENCWNLFSSSTMSNNNSSSNNNNNTSDNARAFWESRTRPTILDSTSNNPRNSFTSAAAAAAAVNTSQREENGAVQAILFDDVHHTSCLYGGGGVGGGGGVSGSHSYCCPDPHLMCLKLGKRHYFGDAAAPLGERQEAVSEAGFSMTKRGKPYFADGLVVGASTSAAGVTVAASSPAVVPRCQVDGCHVALVNAKDYHRRHKVCEMHSKAPKVVVLGLEQRFCQQCSRFHAVEEFDESKRSCRRRLAGHNERRRKSSQDQSAPRNHSPVNGKLMTCGGRHPYFPLSNGCALSLLSSKNDSWISSADLPARCSAALCELIAENRAAILARQLILDKDLPWNYHSNVSPNARQNGSNSLGNCQQQLANNDTHSWDHISQPGGHATMDLKQAQNSAFGFLSLRGKSKEDEESPELWGSFGGAHVV